MNTHTWDTIPATEVRPGVTRKVFTGDGSMLVMTEVHPGAEELPHAHPFEQLVFVVEGSANFTLGEEKFAVSAGDVYRVPPETPHGAEVTGEGPCRLLAVYGPPREDYLIHCEYQKK